MLTTEDRKHMKHILGECEADCGCGKGSMSPKDKEKGDVLVEKPRQLKSRKTSRT